jgi:hypothetical protein
MRRIHFSCDEAIEGLNKKRRVSYHNLKNIIRQIRSTSDKQIEALIQNQIQEPDRAKKKLKMKVLRIR